MSIWESRIDEIQAMANRGLTDEQIGAAYNRSGTTIWKVRQDFGIRQKPKKRKSFVEVFFPPVEAAPELGTYTDEEGRTITRCPTRYAEGAGVQSVTARPRR